MKKEKIYRGWNLKNVEVKLQLLDVWFWQLSDLSLCFPYLEKCPNKVYLTDLEKKVIGRISKLSNFSVSEPSTRNFCYFSVFCSIIFLYASHKNSIVTGTSESVPIYSFRKYLKTLYIFCMLLNTFVADRHRGEVIILH